MRRKQRAVPAPHRKATFSRTELKRAIKTADSVGRPVTRIDLLPNGGLSLFVGKAASDSGDDPINEQQLKELI